MKRISAYFFSLLFVSSFLPLMAQDTIPLMKKIGIGADIYGPVSYFTDRNNLSLEGFLSVDIDTGRSLVIETGYLNFRYSQYNYEYKGGGVFFRLGVDFNTLQPDVSLGKYYAGIGLRYGLSIYRSEVPRLEYENYWGTVTGSFPSETHMAHFIEASPGIRAELLRNLSIGWAVRLRLMIFAGTDRNLKPVFVPGYGNGTKSFSPGLNYYIIWSIPYKKF